MGILCSINCNVPQKEIFSPLAAILEKYSTNNSKDSPTSIGGEKQASISGGSHLPADIASGRIAEVRSKNAKAFLNK